MARTVDAQWNEKQVKEAIYEDIDSALGEGCYAGEAVAKQEANVDSGRMRAATHSTHVSRFLWILHNDVDYSPFQEFGWIHSPGKAFMRPGAAAGAARIRSRLRRTYG